MADQWISDKTCSGCGNDLEQTLVKGHTYDVDIDTVCHACAALATVKRDIHEKHKDDRHIPGRQMWEDGRIHTVTLLESGVINAR